ncbi:MAG: hypothetical protein HN337_05595 [Deltaproteobacteria bacterium]|jgi:hypothetical protein|nr:hypothetical protein [Deltaproteobacteria bacterium]
MNRSNRLALVIALAALLISACGGGGGGGDSDSGESDPTIATIATGEFAAASLSQSTIGADGGTITSTDIPGFEIEIPAGAVDANETITFTVKTATVNSAEGLPDGVAAGSTMYQVATSGSDGWNVFRMFDLAVRVTLPYTTPGSGEDIPSFYVYNSDGTLEPTGFEDIDKTSGTTSFYVRTFANSGETPDFAAAIYDPIKASAAATQAFTNFVDVGVQALFFAWLADGVTIGTGFTAASDGWYIPNFGSYYEPSRQGNCHGMVSFAKYYFRTFGAGFRSKYHDADDTTTWVDDETAIQLASRAHGAEVSIWNQFTSNELSIQTSSSRDVALSYVGGLFVTNQPVLLYIKQRVQNAAGAWVNSGEHAIMVYKAEVSAGGVITFHVYDPNYPNDDTRRITYTDGTGFTNYSSGTTAESSSYSYNYFKHMGYYAGASDDALKGIKESADQGFTGDTIFPTITITSITGKTNGEDVMADTGITAEGEDKYITSDTAVIISGTVLGGRAQTAGSVVDNISIISPDGTTEAAVDNQAGAGTGAFSATIPLPSGENEVVLIASKNNSYSYWAAFDRMIVESTASPQSMTVTLTWGQGESDVDLYVKEPNFTSGSTDYTGDTVYYSHRKGISTTNPYLDFDNTSGYGPEHYIGEAGMSTLANDSSTENPDGLYGDYEFKVHYYADHDSDTETTQPINWTVNYEYMAYCASPCESPKFDGFWVSGSESGALSTANSGNCCNINNTGADWSSAFDIEYPEPDPDDWVIPESRNVMLP